MGFKGNAADVNRFAARYRAAKCFQHIEFEELTATTAAGYSSLMKLLLVYSAFEHLLRCIGLELKASHTLLTETERDRALVNLRGLQGQERLFDTLRQHLDPPYRRQVEAHLKEEACNVFYLAASIRHAFAHGLLTATPGNAPQQTVSTVCGFLCRALVRVMDREFLGRMEDFKAGIALAHGAGHQS